MANRNENIETTDCSPFDSKWGEQLHHFAENYSGVSIFKISTKQEPSDPIISFNYQDKKWYSGRYIGDIHFNYENSDVSISIKPRFGDLVLFKMFEEIFNIKFSEGKSSFQLKNKSYYLRILISFIWLQKLANANRHGLPRKKTKKINEDFTVRGKLLIISSILSIHRTSKVVSERIEKEFDQAVIKILYQAYRILKEEYQLGTLKFPNNAVEAIQTMEDQIPDIIYVEEFRYKAIKYHPMYQRYKDVVDFSWQIIQSESGNENQSNKNNVSGFFLDMAEIWECYVRSILKKQFISSGWEVIDSEYFVYSDKFYRRKMIPDIVMKRDNTYCVFDAKYKDMKYRQGLEDVDRNDFFQIHTYISFIKTKGDVLLGGLIYPVTNNNNNIDISACPLYGKDLYKTYFFADGPDVIDDSIITDKFFSRIAEIMLSEHIEEGI